MKFEKITKIILAVFLACIGTTTYAQPDWSVNPNEYMYSMTITGKLKLNGKFSVNENDFLAAFINDECRGVASVKYQSVLDEYLVFLMIYSNDLTGTVSFKVYDSQQDSTNFTNETIDFTVNDIVGSVANPFVFTTSTDPPIVYTDQANILSFSLPNQIGETNYSGSSISVTLPYSSSLGSMVSNFTLSKGANAYVSDRRIISGVTTLNYNNRVEFEIVSEDLTVSKLYYVNVEMENSLLSDILLSENEIDENSSLILVGNLKAVFEGLQNEYEISLVNSLNNDNPYFCIVRSLENGTQS